MLNKKLAALIGLTATLALTGCARQTTAADLAFDAGNDGIEPQ